MNILASYNWIKEYLETDATPEEFAKQMSLKSMSVESIDRLKHRFSKMVIGEVKELKAHPNADRLKIALTDIGDKTIDIVCGGQNLKLGMKVVVALVGAKVLWHGQGEPVEMKETEVRGVVSQGMICAANELGFDKVACGEKDIWDLSELTSADTGTSFVDAMDMDDVIFDIEVTTNRPDSMCIIGLAREGGVVTDAEFEFKKPDQISDGSGKDLKVEVQDSDLCPRYMAVVIDNVKVGPSPAWLQTKLLLSGHRPINNIVDITNYILHEYGQPLHAFDYDKLESNTIIVRTAEEGEKIKALDENTYELHSNNLIIADAQKPIAVAGVMGGEPTGTHDNTTTIVFEAASFDPVSVRRTGRALNLYSDSQLLFEKGLSAQSPEVALAKAVELTLEIAGGNVASKVYDVRSQEYQPLVFKWRPQKSRDVIGVDLSDNEMKTILEKLGFVLQGSNGEFEVTIPFWRDHDIEAEIDFTEEIARVYGYHNIPAKLPDTAPPTTFEDSELAWEDQTRKLMASFGYSEFYGYSFVSDRNLESYDLDPERAVKLLNPLSSELTHMRTSLIPSVLKDVEMNQGQTSSAQIFELARVYLKQDSDLPKEQTRFVFGEFGVKNVQAAFLKQKATLESWAKSVGLDLKLEREQENVHWHPTRSAKIVFKDQNIGFIGQVAYEYQKAFGIKEPVVLVDIDFEALADSMKIERFYQSIPEFPAVVRDIAVEVGEKLEFSELKSEISNVDQMIRSIDLKEVYQGEKIEAGKKSVTLSITLRSDDKTLESQEVDQIMEKVVQRLVDSFNAKVR